MVTRDEDFVAVNKDCRDIFLPFQIDVNSLQDVAGLEVDDVEHIARFIVVDHKGPPVRSGDSPGICVHNFASSARLGVLAEHAVLG